MENLLVELFVEELPPKSLKNLGAAFANALAQSLKAQGLCAADALATPYATPRRLAAHLGPVLSQAPETPQALKLMPVNVGLDAAGQPTPALLKKLAALGQSGAALTQAVSKLRRAHDGKTEALWFDSVRPGVTLATGLQQALEEALKALPIPKVMSYQLADGWSTVHFVRPAHGLLALHGRDEVAVTALGLTAGRTTHGHRFAAARAPIEIASADSYVQQLATEGAVIASFAERRAEIARQLQAAAQSAGPGLRPIADDALLDEVTALVEQPNVLIGAFEREFLAVPQECLILTMKANQKYFPLLDAEGRLTHQFLIVANIRPADPSAVIQGNERVVRPRLTDAKFFFDQDRKKTLESRLPGLAKVVYHNQLGTQAERSERVAGIALRIGEIIGGEQFALQAAQAARLAKADLLTDMVGEFPELQGVMGRYYALAEGLPTAIADALEDHYQPRFAGDRLPRGPLGRVTALADKLETLTGLFGIGQLPTGDKDPFGLRRHALGVIRLLSEGGLDLPLTDVLALAAKQFKQAAQFQSPLDALSGFIFERLANNLREQGYTAQEIEAVMSLRPDHLAEVPRRLAAVRAFAALPEAARLAAANKRVANILKKADAPAGSVDAALLVDAAEQALYAALNQVQPAADAAYAQGDYAASLSVLAALKTPVDVFFDQVLVNAEDQRLRANRLGLLAQLHTTMNRVADLAKLSA